MIPYFIGVGVLGLVPIIVGPNRALRLLGVLAIYLSIHFSVSDHILGTRAAEQLSKQREQWKMTQEAAPGGEQPDGAVTQESARSAAP